MSTATLDLQALFDDPQAAERLLADASLRLADADEAPGDVLALAGELAAALVALARGDWPAIDPWLLVELMQTAAAIEQTLHREDARRQTEELEVQLEALREIFGDLRQQQPIGDARPALEVARWLKQTTQASNQELALLGPSKRTWERWLSPTGDAAPHGDDEMRVRIAARIVNQLRHALTGRGALRWFELPHPALGGAAPATLLGDPRNSPELVALASELRRSDAA